MRAASLDVAPVRSKIRVSYLYTSIFSNFGLGTLCHRKRLADFGLISDHSDAHAHRCAGPVRRCYSSVYAGAPARSEHA